MGPRRVGRGRVGLRMCGLPAPREWTMSGGVTASTQRGRRGKRWAVAWGTLSCRPPRSIWKVPQPGCGGSTGELGGGSRLREPSVEGKSSTPTPLPVSTVVSPIPRRRRLPRGMLGGTVPEAAAEPHGLPQPLLCPTAAPSTSQRQKRSCLVGPETLLVPRRLWFSP